MVNILISTNEEQVTSAVDQSSSTDNGYTTFGGVNKRAQSFQIGTTKNIIMFDVRFNDTTVAAGWYDVTLELQTNSGSLPSGTVLATKTRKLYNSGTSVIHKQKSSLTATGWVRFKLHPDERIELTAATTYWIVMSADTTNCFSWRLHNANPYASGNGASDTGGGWGANATWDFTFYAYTSGDFSLEDIGGFVTSLSWSRRTNASSSATIELANPFGKFTNENMTAPSGYTIGNYKELSRGMSIAVKIPNGSTDSVVFRGVVVSNPSQSSTAGNTLSIEALGFLEVCKKRYIAKRYRRYDYDVITFTYDTTNNPESESRLNYVEDILDNLIYTQTDLYTNYGLEFWYDRDTNPDILHLIEKDYVFDYKTVFECMDDIAESTAREIVEKLDGTIVIQTITDPTATGTTSPHPTLVRGETIVSDSLETNYDNLRNQIIIEGKNGLVVIEEDLESIEDYELAPFFEKRTDLETIEELATYAQLLLKKYTTLNKSGGIELKEFVEQCTSTIPNSFLDIFPGDIVKVEDEIIGLYNYDDSEGDYYRVETINFTYDGSLSVNINVESIKQVSELVDIQTQKNLDKATTGGEQSIDMITSRTAVIKIAQTGTYSSRADNNSRIGYYDSGNYDFDPSLHTSHYGT